MIEADAIPVPRPQPLGQMLLGGFIVLIGQVVFLLVTGGWGAKISVSEHRADIAAIRAEAREQQMELLAAIQRLKDAVCADKPEVPQCNR